MVDEAKRAGVQRIVKLSVYGAAEEAFTFARWHRGVEKHIEASGLAWTFLRPSGFMQNFFNYMGETIRKQSAFYTATGATARARTSTPATSARWRRASSPARGTTARPTS